MTYISIEGCKLALSTKELDEKINQKMIDIKLVDKEFDGYLDLSEEDKEALDYLIKAARVFNDVFLKQDHKQNIFYRDVLKRNANKNDDNLNAYKLFNSLNGVEGLDGISENPIEIFEGVKGNQGRNFYPDDLSVEDFHSILIDMIKSGVVEEVRKILSNRTMVEYAGEKLTAIDYTQYFAEEFSEISKYLEKAAELVSNNEFSNYLYAQSKALLFKNEEFDCEADLIWANMQDTELEFTLSRENYTDEMTGTVLENEELSKLLNDNNIEVNPKDDFGVRVGLVNKKGTNLILEFKKHMANVANLMPLTDKYEQKISDSDEVKQTMVDVDLVCLSGDYAAARGGVTIAQNLPNDDKLSIIRGGGRRNVYHRQVRQTSDKDKTKRMLEALVSKDKHKYYNNEADHLFVIGHENGHSLGPDASFKSQLGNYSHTIEECKADLVSVSYMPYYMEKNVISENDLKEIYSTWAIKHLMSAKPHPSKPHRMGDLMQFNYYIEKDAFFFDDDGKFDFDIEKMETASKEMLEEIINIQLSKSPNEAKSFIDKWAYWSDKSAEIAKIQQSLGIKQYKNIICNF